MSTIRQQITDALKVRLEADEWLGPVADGEPAEEDWRAFDGAVAAEADFCALIDEGVAEHGPALLGDGGPLYDLELTLTAAFAVRSPNNDTRKARRDQAIGRIGAAVLPDLVDQPDRSSLGGLAVWTFIGLPELDNTGLDGGVPVWVARVPVKVWFTATQPTG